MSIIDKIIKKRSDKIFQPSKIYLIFEKYFDNSTETSILNDEVRQKI